MFGKLPLKRAYNRWIRRKDFTIWLITTGCFLLALIAFAIYDFLSTAQAKEDQVQAAVLRSELAQFVLALREDDSYALIDNLTTLSKTTRSLTAVVLKKPFFTYFLNRGNAKSFDTKKIAWEAPRSCVVDFTGKAEKLGALPPQISGLRACLAVVPNEPIGRFIYFSMRYPASSVVRHNQGASFSSASHVTVDLKGDRTLRVTLVFEPATLAVERYPSQKLRFIGLHEVTAYFAEDPKRPLRTFQGQAFEQRVDNDSGSSANYVTILGRFDASLVTTSQGSLDQWSSGSVPLSAAVSVYTPVDPLRPSSLHFQTAYDTEGESVTSLAKLYKSYVLSKASVEIAESVASSSDRAQAIWRSGSVFNSNEARVPSRIQKISDWWANQMVGLLGYRNEPVIVKQNINFGRDVLITLRADRATLPDLATRAFLFLSVALLVVIGVTVLWGKALIELNRIAQTAHRITVSPTSDETLESYAKRRNEIGTLGRVFHLLIRRARSRNAGLIRRAKRDEFERTEKIRVAHDQVMLRQAALDAIGHEIKSPLQALLSKTDEGSELRNHIDRMSRAVEALYFTTSIEAGFRSGRIAVRPGDVAEFLTKLAKNLSGVGTQISYSGPDASVIAVFDPIALEQVFDHLFENATRYGDIGTQVQIGLQLLEDVVQIEVFNQGPHIKVDPIDSIFNYGVSSRLSTKNRGQGLFVSRTYVVGMKGSIYAENRPGGVTFVITLPRK